MITLRWLGQSGYLLNYGKTAIAIDPYLSDSVEVAAGCKRLFAPPILPSDLNVDAVICTHDHLDHLDPDTVAELSNETSFFTTHQGISHLQMLGKRNAYALEEGASADIGGIYITAVYALHTVEAFGIIVQCEDITLYFSGDTLFDERLFKTAEFCPDIAFLCINGKLGNMNLDEAVNVANQINASVSIPNHYGMFASNTENPEKFVEAVKGSVALKLFRPYEIEKKEGRVVLLG